MAIVTPVVSKVASPFKTGISQAGAGGQSLDSAIRALFANGEQGAWYDPSDFSTMFQDAAGTTPVTAVGQPVGRILDKSGRGNHASQATSASRPLLQQDGNGKYYLAFDGVDDSLATASVNFTATDKMTVLAGARKSASADGVIVELSPQYNLNNGSFDLQSRADPTGITLFIRGNLSTGALTNPAFSAGVAAVVTAKSQIASEWVHSLSVNAGTPVLGSNNVGTGNFGNYPLYIGRRGGTSFPFNGNIYQLILRGAATPLADIQDAESFVAEKTGVTL